MNKQEALKRIEVQKETLISLTGWAVYVYIEELIKSLDEPEKVKIPQFVADWIEYCKRGLSIRQAISQVHVGIEVDDWLMEVDADGVFVNQETFARAWLDGYEVEKEKRYLVRVKGICGNHATLNREKHSNKWLFSDREENSLYGTHHTRKELEDADFGWVFDCEGVEIEEVEG